MSVPYIPLDYSEAIVICKRCRFKFHSDCIKDKIDNLETWICNFCKNKIKELQSQNLWDYQNNK